MCNNSRDDAVELLTNHYKIKKESPEFFKNRDVTSDDIQSCLNNQDYVILPRTPDNCHLILFRLKSFEPSDYDFDSSAKTYIMTFGKADFSLMLRSKMLLK